METSTDNADEMGGACSTNEGEEESVYVIGREARRKETTM
jgi:hypothetical protein